MKTVHRAPAKILVVEAEPGVRDVLTVELSEQGYTVSTATDGLEALEAAHNERPDLVIMAVQLPSLSGLEVCRLIRQASSVPIMLLSARAEEMDKVIGLEVGADDYVTKPFSVRELLARVKALLRRVQLVRKEMAIAHGTTLVAEGAVERFVFADLLIDFKRHEVRCNGVPAHLKPKEFDLLVLLARNHGRALSRELIFKRIWGEVYDSDSRTVDMHVSTLRDKIEPDPTNPTRVVSVRGVGYRFDG